MNAHNIKTISSVESVRGQITLPGDKSMSHRALMFAAIAKGSSKIKHLNIGADALSTIACLQKLGVDFQLGKFTVDVNSPGLNGWTQPADGILNCGNSGTTVRLMAGLVAGREGLTVTMTGDDSLSSRPMKRVINPLEKMGANISSNDGKLPMTIVGSQLDGIHYKSPVASAQVKSCVLFAGLSAQGKTYLEEPVKSRDHTENMMKMFRIPVFNNKNVLSVHTLKRNIPGFNYSVPGDPSSAAYWVAAGLLLPKSRLFLRKMSLNPTRIAFVELLKSSGADIEIVEKDYNLESMGDLVVRSSKLRAFNVRAKQVPGLIDELPLLALVATQAKGVSTIRGAKELRFKESDRIKSTIAMLRNIGATVEELEDGMIIQGDTKLKGGTVDAHDDHRIAMTASIAGLISKEPVKIEGWSCVEISYPAFYHILDRIGKIMKYGLLGHNIAYSLSPVIHKMINRSGIEYEILDISPEDLKKTLPQITKGFSGFNITIPHKESVMALCDEVDTIAARIGAVNTVKIADGYWKAYNTDYLGFMETVKNDIPDFFSYHPVILGYGGVARAVLFALQELGFTACSVMSGVNKNEREAFIENMNSVLNMNVIDQIPVLNKLWINCTPIGSSKLPDIPVNFIDFNYEDILYDLNYSPYPTHLEKIAREQGLKTLNGMKMLVSQAIEAEKIWNKGSVGLNCDTDEIIRSLVTVKSVS